MKILFENNYYRISKELADSPSNITYICYDHFLLENHATLPSAFGKPFARKEVLALGFNYIAVQSRSNDFFQRDGFLEGLEEISKIKAKDEKYISYGGSQGGYASISFYNLAKCDLFFAIAPLLTSNKDFMESINDDRTPGVTEFFRYDFILDDQCLNANGLIIYDPTYNLDEKHVNIIKEKTESELVFVPGSKHFPANIVAKKYGLKKILEQLPSCIGSKEKLSKLADCINEVINSDENKGS